MLGCESGAPLRRVVGRAGGGIEEGVRLCGGVLSLLQGHGFDVV